MQSLHNPQPSPLRVRFVALMIAVVVMAATAVGFALATIISQASIREINETHDAELKRLAKQYNDNLLLLTDRADRCVNKADDAAKKLEQKVYP